MLSLSLINESIHNSYIVFHCMHMYDFCLLNYACPVETGEELDMLHPHWCIINIEKDIRTIKLIVACVKFSSPCTLASNFFRLQTVDGSLHEAVRQNVTQTFCAGKPDGRGFVARTAVMPSHSSCVCVRVCVCVCVCVCKVH